MKTSEALKAILRNTLEQYDFLAASSRETVLMQLAPGTKAPESGKLHTEEAKQRYSAYLSEARKKALEIIDGEIAKANKAIAAAPSTEAINTLTAFSMAKPKNRRDYEAIYSEYGSNPQIAKALNTLARENDVQFMVDVPGYDRLQLLEDCRSSFDRWLTFDNQPTAGSTAFAEYSLDMYGLD